MSATSISSSLYTTLMKNITSPEDIIKLTHLLQSEEEALFKRKIKGVLEQEYQLDRLGPILKNIKTLSVNNSQLLKEKNALLHNNGYLWVTINPDPKVPLEQFMKIINKITTYSCFSQWEFVIEQRGTIAKKNIGHGFHAHLLFKRNLSYKPKDLIFKIKRGAKNLVKDVNNNHQLNFAVIGDDFAKDKITYMNGSKDSE